MGDETSEETGKEITAVDTDTQLEAAWLTRLEGTLNKLIEVVQGLTTRSGDDKTRELLEQLLSKLSNEPTTSNVKQAEQILETLPPASQRPQRKPLVTRKRR